MIEADKDKRGNKTKRDLTAVFSAVERESGKVGLMLNKKRHSRLTNLLILEHSLIRTTTSVIEVTTELYLITAATLD